MMTTTTNQGGGRPRLAFAVGGSAPRGAEPREVSLREDADGRPVERAALHTGDRIELGGWTMSYLRDEHADHGRPLGGRSGGESVSEHPPDA